jgi:7-keto-8-aminopelargonate synthetase-like enzyme
MAWTEVVLRMLPSLTVERVSLKENQKYLQQQLQLSGIPYVGTSHILAIILGDNKKCIELAEILKLRQIKVQAIRPPTVPQGTSRLRISLHSALSTNDIDLFVNIIKQNID